MARTDEAGAKGPVEATATGRGGGFLSRFGRLMGAVNASAENPACPYCGTGNVQQLKRLDLISPMSWTLWSALQKMLGGKLYVCHRCRIQFYDARPPTKAQLPVRVRRPAQVSPRQ